jgi:hypothetical protein
VRLIVSGTPSAVPLADPKLDRMSLRTMPDWSSALGPLDPSPGYGPGRLLRDLLAGGGA